MRGDNDIFKSISGRVEAKDINLVLKSSYQILFSLKKIFKDKDQPEHIKGAELSLTVDIAEEFKYPVGKEWNLLLHCVRVHKQNLGIYVPPLTSQQEGSSSQPEVTIQPEVAMQQVQVLPPFPASSNQPVPHPSQYVPRQPLQFTIPRTSVPLPQSSAYMSQQPFLFSSLHTTVPFQQPQPAEQQPQPVEQQHPQQHKSSKRKSRKQSEPKTAASPKPRKKKGSSKDSSSTKETKQ
jgi:hypothetical protein